MRKIDYNREDAIFYAKKWAFLRNPIYYNFDKLGGDCTNFVSQCVFSGSKIMNFDKDLGWYYNSLNSRAPAWTGVKFFYDFLTENKSFGPFGEQVNKSEIVLGDVIFLLNEQMNFYHTLFVNRVTNGQIFCSAHTFDAFDRPLQSYLYFEAKFIHIIGVNA